MKMQHKAKSQRVGIIEINADTPSNTRLLWEPGANEILQQRNGNTNAVRKNYFAQGFVDHTGGGAATSYYYTRDHLGSIREVTDSTGTVVSRYDYSLWGERTLTSGTDLADFAFTGHYYHKPSHLHLTWFRAYDAELGRWLSRDPLRDAELKADSTNLYVYVAKQVMNYLDAAGLCGTPSPDCLKTCKKKLDSYNSRADATKDELMQEASYHQHKKLAISFTFAEKVLLKRRALKMSPRQTCFYYDERSQKCGSI